MLTNNLTLVGIWYNMTFAGRTASRLIFVPKVSRFVVCETLLQKLCTTHRSWSKSETTASEPINIFYTSLTRQNWLLDEVSWNVPTFEHLHSPWCKRFLGTTPNSRLWDLYCEIHMCSLLGYVSLNHASLHSLFRWCWVLQLLPYRNGFSPITSWGEIKICNCTVLPVLRMWAFTLHTSHSEKVVIPQCWLKTSIGVELNEDAAPPQQVASVSLYAGRNSVYAANAKRVFITDIEPCKNKPEIRIQKYVLEIN